jgi:hypothetical protein
LSLLSAWPDYFHQLTQRDRCIVLEKQFYQSGRSKPDLISIRDTSGRNLASSGVFGFYSSHLLVPAVVFEYFVQEGIVYHDDREDDGTRSIFRLTPAASRIARQSGYQEPMTIPQAIASLLDDMMEEAARPRTQREEEANNALAWGVGSIEDVIEAKRAARQSQSPRARPRGA